jgi:hypothetical protein
LIGRAAIADALSGLVVFLAASFASFCIVHWIKRVTKVIRPFVAEDILVSHAPKQVEDLQSAREPVTAPLLNLVASFEFCGMAIVCLMGSLP